MEPQFYPIRQPHSDTELSEIVRAIETIRPLLDQGLLRESELTNLEQNASNAYEDTVDHDSIQYRKYDRDRRSSTRWHQINRSGYVNTNDAVELFELQQQIIELLNLHSVDIQPTELFIPANSQYTARFYIRNILSQATKSIDIKDDYLFSANNHTKNIDMLYILGPYLQGSLNIKCRLLGDNTNPPAGTASDIKLFLKQYPSATIKGATLSVSGKRETHDRFIILNHSKVFRVGASIKDLGSAQTGIDMVNSSTVSNSYIQQFETWWNASQDYSNLI